MTLALLVIQILLLIYTKKWCEARQKLSINDELKTIVIPEQDQIEIGSPNVIIRKQCPLEKNSLHLTPLLENAQCVHSKTKVEVSRNEVSYRVETEHLTQHYTPILDGSTRKLGVRGDGYSFIFLKDNLKNLASKAIK